MKKINTVLLLFLELYGQNVTCIDRVMLAEISTVCSLKVGAKAMSQKAHLPVAELMGCEPNRHVLAVAQSLISLPGSV